MDFTTECGWSELSGIPVISEMIEQVGKALDVPREDLPRYVIAEPTLLIVSPDRFSREVMGLTPESPNGEQA